MSDASRGLGVVGPAAGFASSPTSVRLPPEVDRPRTLSLVDPRTRRLVTLGVLVLSIALVLVAAVRNR